MGVVNGNGLWKWVAGLIASFALGGGISTFVGNSQYASVRAEVAVMKAVQTSQLDLIKSELTAIKVQLAEIGTKLDERTRPSAGRGQ